MRQRLEQGDRAPVVFQCGEGLFPAMARKPGRVRIQPRHLQEAGL